MIHLEIEEEPWTHRDPAWTNSLFTLGRWSTLTSVLVQLGDATTHLATGFWEWKLHGMASSEPMVGSCYSCKLPTNELDSHVSVINGNSILQKMT